MAVEPDFKQIFIGQSAGLDRAAFERRLYVIRRRVEQAVDALTADPSDEIAEDAETGDDGQGFGGAGGERKQQAAQDGKTKANQALKAVPPKIQVPWRASSRVMKVMRASVRVPA